MKVIAVVNQKGGVGKTTTVYNLAAALAAGGKRVVMIDLDPQASLTLSCRYEPDIPDFAGHHISDVLEGRASLRESCFTIDALDDKGKVASKISLLPGSLELANTEAALTQAFGPELAKKQLRKALSEAGDICDYVVIDCPPQFSVLTINALMAATHCLVPTRVDYLSYRGLKNVLTTIRTIQHDNHLNPDLMFIGGIITFFRKTVTSEREMLVLIKKEIKVIGVVKESADVGRYMPWGLPVVLAVPKSDAAKEYVEIAKGL